MFKAICELESVTPYSQGKFFNEKKPKDITHEDFEKQTWAQANALNARWQSLHSSYGIQKLSG